VKFGSRSINATFIIVKDLSHDVLIGMDIMVPNNCELRLGENKLICNGETININTRKALKEKMICANTRIQIEPMSSIVYEHYIKDKIVNKAVLIEKLGRYDTVESLAKIENEKISIRFKIERIRK
jgi:hypothetical protein